VKKIFKYLSLVLLTIFLLLQFYPRPPKNSSLSGSIEKDISNRYPVPAEVKAILQASCNDCHSANTNYPWYSYIQPVSMWLGNHIKDGKRHLDFSDFLSYRIAKQYHKLEEVEETVENGEMPISSYTLIHKSGKLDAIKKAILVNWSRALRDSIRANYPADSLIMPKKKK
jgi:hypothetical protein